MKDIRTFEEINDKIERGEAVVVTAEEITNIVEEDGPQRVAKEVDVVTTGTFGPMCSSGVVLNFGHSDPPIRMQKIWLNDVLAHGGLAAVDTYLGATSPSKTMDDYGGAHVIESLVKGEKITLRAKSLGTDCYPRKLIETEIALDDINEAIMFNPRNCFQNYNVGINTSDKIIHTYMGTLLPNMGNANYSTTGQLSPLLNDPKFKTIGVGTKIFLCGAQGNIIGNGTQHNPKIENINGITIYSGGTIAVTGNLKEMSIDFMRAAYFPHYGVTLYVGIGVPIPILNEGILRDVSVCDKDIYTYIKDYSVQKREKPTLGLINYEELRSGKINLNGQEIPTSSLSSYAKGREIAETLKEQIKDGRFKLQRSIKDLPSSTKSQNLMG